MDDTGADQLLVMITLDASDNNLQHSHAVTYTPSTITTSNKKASRTGLMPQANDGHPHVNSLSAVSDPGMEPDSLLLSSTIDLSQQSNRRRPQQQCRQQRGESVQRQGNEVTRSSPDVRRCGVCARQSKCSNGVARVAAVHNTGPACAHVPRLPSRCQEEVHESQSL